jgi:SSS family solute:Na+ symporter
MEISLHMKGSTYPLHLFGRAYPAYAACYALALNLFVTLLLTAVLDAIGVRRHVDATSDDDYEDDVQPSPSFERNIAAIPAEF